MYIYTYIVNLYYDGVGVISRDNKYIGDGEFVLVLKF